MSGLWPLPSSGGTGEAQQQQRQGLQTGLRGSDTEALPTMESSYTLPDQGTARVAGSTARVAGSTARVAGSTA